ncbi:MAG: hypothetical protein GY953_22335 [bacterium]|nr:hypothetical protein [bacterium]
MLAPSSSGCRERGIAILTTAVFMLALVPILGLAIDASFLYAAKAKLAAATDAAALAAARSAEESPLPRSRVNAYFQANFPPGYLNTSEPRLQVDFRQAPPSGRVVTVTVTLKAPTFFLGAIGWNQATIQATSAAAAGQSGVRLIS